MEAQGMIHPQLLADCHRLGRLEECELLLHRNALLPWFILVPATAVDDVLDLDPDDLQRVLAGCAAISRYIKRELDYPKVNFAGLGNVVPQMHLHVIGRRPGDACWPSPVWGALPDGPEYAAATIDDWVTRLQRDYGLCETA
jgi:diadenosine tetraphosphate (Ap4A) HIT family hydrolase